MKIDTSVDHFDKMTEFVSQEAKSLVLDSLACVFHNEGFWLSGNTEDSDTAWLADRISKEINDTPLDRVSLERRQELMQVASAAKKCIPLLAERIASRYIRVSQAIRTSERIEKRQDKLGLSQ